MADFEARGSGRTTRQMQGAPYGATFVWCNSHTRWAEQLAHDLGRDDLKIVGPRFLTDERWWGLEHEPVLDHALMHQPAIAKMREYFRLRASRNANG